MADLREVFEMVKQQTEPDIDSWAEQERRIRRTAQKRKIGAYALVAAIAVAAFVFVLSSPNDDPDSIPATERESVPPAPVRGFAQYDLDTGAMVGTGIVADSSSVDVSPDGTKIAYADSVNGLDNAVVHVANVDGSNVQAFNRTNAVGMAMAPRWSSDGTKLVYQGKTAGQDIGNLYVLDVTTGRIERITDLEPMTVGLWWMGPTFSPDGQTVFFTKPRRESNGADGSGVRWDLWSVPASGGEPTLVHRNAWGVDVSPTGDAIAYSEALNIDGEFTLGDLYVARPDGSGARKVADGPTEMPRWSSDGSQIAYAGGVGMYILDVEILGDGTVVPVGETHYPDAPGWPDWVDQDTLMIEVGVD
jgi:hypothetical protein